MSRISRPVMFMQMAEAASRRSTCFRRSVGALLVTLSDANIVSVGYNGPPSGDPHCTGATCPTNHVCTRALHAERNAIERCQSREALGMYVTESPCLECAKLILADNRIHQLAFMHLYRDPAGLNELLPYMPVWRITPSGYVTNHATGELIENP